MLGGGTECSKQKLSTRKCCTNTHIKLFSDFLTVVCLVTGYLLVLYSRKFFFSLNEI